MSLFWVCVVGGLLYALREACKEMEAMDEERERLKARARRFKKVAKRMFRRLKHG